MEKFVSCNHCTSNEYTKYFMDILEPIIYESLQSMYKQAVDISKQADADDRIIMIFQKLLRTVSNWDPKKIEEETARIKDISKCEYLDDLVRIMIKSKICVLTNSNNANNVIPAALENELSTCNVIHKCYIECVKDAHNHPFLFYHEIDPIIFKQNQIMAANSIRNGIDRGIRKTLPVEHIIKNYV